jgi:Polysaccharide deacetylase
MPKKVLVGYGIDVDAVSGWLNTQNGTPADVTNISRGIFGATVGTDRLLKMLDKHKIKASWYIPAHTIESFPQQMARVRDTGHEM